MYINGVLENSISIGSGTTPAIPMYIGRFTSGTGYEIAGQIPIVKIYNKALLASEVYNNYIIQKARFGL